MAKNEKQIRKLVGRIDGDYYICDYIFNDSPDFHGATATVLRPVSADERDNRTNPHNSDTKNNFKELWQDQVQAGQTEQSFEDWLEELLAVDGDEAVFDFSGYEYWDLLREAEPELTEEDYPIFERAGGGRSFSADMKFDKVYDEELWTQIQKAETVCSLKEVK